ncbi:hypothetical protein TVAG_349020 [Trichomonas vaginalis G3]|uniref:Molybdate-anion transporter n=1 Tax=Trichomonas vaginalis (strain ATCC PRA-98 / G3) TaxID=412133 RepID=A2G4H4_TRIV3|nr:SAM (S-adenosyl methionine) transporter family [Trichomonas vaginalis G3]EAX87940.1 hypothetical protein TVAG_349020 [Trichomonas vaginalis G3]KAI5521933.1 SAM (S-adenosyl methionine) transporter family [Trichomonas vaginalis G3]|eukprot:XP_001300870.1 hypothetical protein [Trichomonas vaginalis G3]
MALFITTSMIFKASKGAKPQCKNLLKVQIVYYFVFFAMTAADNIAAVYFNPFWKFRHFSNDEITTICLYYEISSVVGSLLCTYILNLLGTRISLTFCCFFKFLAIFAILISPNPVFAYTSKFFWGLGYMTTKIWLDDWLLDLTIKYELSVNDRGILLNYRMVFVFVLDLITTNKISVFIANRGLIPTFWSLAGYYLAIIIPSILVMHFLTGSPSEKPKKEEEKSNIKVSQVPMRTISLMIYDIIYIFTISFFKSLFASNFQNQKLPFSVIMSTFNAMGTLGTIVSSVILEYVSNKQLRFIILIGFAVDLFTAFFFPTNDFVMYFVTINLGLFDGMITPVIITMRKEDIPADIRVRCLSLVRTLTSLLGFFITFVMKFCQRKVYFAICASLFVFCLFLPVYQAIIYKIFLIGAHLYEKISLPSNSSAYKSVSKF